MDEMIKHLICMGLVLSGDICPTPENVVDLQIKGVEAPHGIIFINSP